ncbi:MAG: alpha/beta hydrolase [Deltaproteobacteria bacterium]|nr:alpha/beta hydrolase [Deltaproteobacteria bacterium]
MSFDVIKKARVGDLEIAYREVGSGEPILFVHGWPLSSLTWRKVVPELARERRCIALDLLGAGESTHDPDRDHSIPAQAKVVAGFMDALDLRQATLVGHDSGGSIVRTYTVAHPERVSRLVLADTEVPERQSLLVNSLKTISRLPGAKSIMGMTFSSRALAKSPLGFGLCFSHLNTFDFDEFFRILVAPNAASDVKIRSSLRFMRDFAWKDVDEPAAKYAELKMPKYVLWGEDDKFFSLEQGWRLRELLPAPTRFDIIPGCGLFIHEEKPSAYTSAVGSFLKYSSLS